MSPKRDGGNGDDDEEEKRQQEEQQQETPQQKIESWLRRMGDWNAELDVGPGVYHKST